MTNYQVCHQPILPMEVGSTCPSCKHPAPAHGVGTPCVFCWVEAKIALIDKKLEALDALTREGETR